MSRVFYHSVMHDLGLFSCCKILDRFYMTRVEKTSTQIDNHLSATCLVFSRPTGHSGSSSSLTPNFLLLCREFQHKQRGSVVIVLHIALLGENRAMSSVNLVINVMDYVPFLPFLLNDYILRNAADVL